MRYFITGATGFIGGQIARQLLDAGHDVAALVRDPAKAGHLADLGASLHQGDITEKESMREGMAGCDGVFHIAAWYETGIKDTRKAELINVEGTRSVLELMKELGIPKGVYTSTNAVFSDTGGRIVDEDYRFEGKHLSVYDETKWRAQYEVAEPLMHDGLPLVIVHPGLVYGPGDHSAIGAAIRDYLRRRLPVMPLGFKACWAHVEDVARGHILAMEKGRPGENYIIGGPVYSLIEVLELAHDITGIPLPLLRMPPVMLKLSAALLTPIDWVIRLPVTFSPEGMRVTAGVTYTASDAKARRELGFSTRPIEEGMRETLAYELRQLGQEPGFA